MHAQHNRYNNYHSQKRQILGNQPGHAAPAWRANNPAGPASGKKAPEQGSKILLSRLPLDVLDDEVEQLFSKTVGPVKDAFIVYNSQGRSKGMAVVSFQRSTDAALARTKYNGKIVDGRRPIKIEIVRDEEETPRAPEKPHVPSLLERLGAPVPPKAGAAPTAPKKQQTPAAPNAGGPLAPRLVPVNPKKSIRQKKGPRRLKKTNTRRKVNRETLDRDMEDYRAHTDGDLKMNGSS